ncbi:MAG: hypothetical protein WCE54_07120 [Ignavibacteriaceae bacterium]
MNNSEQSASDKKKKKSGVKNLIKDLERNELIEVILELSKISRKNEQFIKLIIQGSNNEHREKIVHNAKSKIRSVFFSKNGYPYEHINLKDARSIVSQYSKILKGFPDSILDLKLYYVESGVEVIKDWGDMYDSFYDSIGSMLTSFCSDLFNNYKYYGDFSKRIDQIIIDTKGVGWGFHEFVLDTIYNLKERLGIYNKDESANENS